jgi:hypothetical protein
MTAGIHPGSHCALSTCHMTRMTSVSALEGTVIFGITIGLRRGSGRECVTEW